VSEQPSPARLVTPAALDPRAGLSEFLRTRRARLQPEDVGLPRYGARRRVPGLRREEVAQLAAVSTAYYTRLEQGFGDSVSREVLDAVGRALRLTTDEHTHLLHLAQPEPERNGRTGGPQHSEQVRPALRELLDAMEGVPAYVVGRRTEILAWNALAGALYPDWAQRRPSDRSWAKLIFLAPEYADLYVDWDDKAAEVVSYLRMDVGRHPDDAALANVVAELTTKSPAFRQLWAANDVKERTHGRKLLRHPTAGELDLSYETFVVPENPDLSLVIHHAERGSRTDEALRLLAASSASAHERSATTD